VPVDLTPLRAAVLGWLPPADAFALGWFLLCALGYNLLTKYQPVYRRSMMAGMQEQRRAWMREMAVREGRFQDIQLLGNLANGHTFFASTSAIVVGGLSAMLGSGEKVQAYFEQLPFSTRAAPVLWEMKLMLLMGLFVYAFFKFAWAFRLAHYSMILIGAAPVYDAARPASALAATDHADLTAHLIGLSAEHGQAGLRSYFYAVAGIAWFVSPYAFILVTTWVLVILVRREFYSRSCRTIWAAKSAINGELRREPKPALKSEALEPR